MEKTFEASLDELENIVSQLEDGDLPLEQSLKLFEDGVKLSRECKERLAKAERRIEMLMKDANGSPSLQELEPESLRGERKTPSGKRIVFEDDEEPF
jgi:exodeoxyribonuclease VII small subunit